MASPQKDIEAPRDFSAAAASAKERIFSGIAKLISLKSYVQTAYFSVIVLLNNKLSEMVLNTYTKLYVIEQATATLH